VLEAKRETTATPVACELEKWVEKSLRSFVRRYRSEIEFGDAETKKAVLRGLVASAVLEDDNLRLVPIYPALTGAKVASPGRRDVNPHLKTIGWTRVA